MLCSFIEILRKTVHVSAGGTLLLKNAAYLVGFFLKTTKWKWERKRKRKKTV